MEQTHGGLHFLLSWTSQQQRILSSTPFLPKLSLLLVSVRTLPSGFLPQPSWTTSLPLEHQCSPMFCPQPPLILPEHPHPELWLQPKGDTFQPLAGQFSTSTSKPPCPILHLPFFSRNVLLFSSKFPKWLAPPFTQWSSQNTDITLLHHSPEKLNFKTCCFCLQSLSHMYPSTSPALPHSPLTPTWQRPPRTPGLLCYPPAAGRVNLPRHKPNHTTS